MTLWCVNIHGPDDVVPVADYPTAIKVANMFNQWWQQQERRENDPRMWAVPIEWPYTEASHTSGVNERKGEYAGFIAAATAPHEPGEAPQWQKLRDLLGLDGWHDGVFAGAANPDQIVTHVAHIANERARLLHASMSPPPEPSVQKPVAWQDDELGDLRIGLCDIDGASGEDDPVETLPHPTPRA